MKKLLAIIFFYPLLASSQTYILRKIQLGPPNDSLYMREGSPDSLWRKNGGSQYTFAFVQKERNYFPAFQLSGTQVPLPVDWTIITNKPPTYNSAAHVHAYNTLTGLPSLFDGSYNSLSNKPVIPTNNNQLTNGNSFLVVADIANKLNTNGNGSSLTGITAAQVGLGNVDNTSDANKPVSSATTTALNLKANLTSASLVTPNIGVASGTSLAVTGNITSSGGSIGYVTGNGGAVVQATNKSTTVVLNKLSGTITLVNSALAASTTVTFTITNSTIAATDVIILNHTSGGTAGSYTLNAQVGAGSATINVRNVSLASLSEAIVIRYTVIKAVIN